MALYLWNVFRVLFEVLGSELCLITFNVIYCNIYTLLFKILGSVRSFIQQGWIKLIKSDSKKMLLFWTIHQRILNIITFLSSTTVFNIGYNKKDQHFWVPNQHIRMISEGSCDNKDWSNGCLKSQMSITDFKNIKKTLLTTSNFVVCCGGIIYFR